MEVITARIKSLVQSMLDEGMLDHQFTQLQGLQDETNPNFVADIINLFCDNTEKTINKLTNYLCEEDVDFCKMTPFVHQLKGSSSSMGARQMELACVVLRQASDDQNKEAFLQALNRITHEYNQLKFKFQTLIQLENTSLNIQSNQQYLHQDGQFVAVSTQDA